MNHIWPNVGKAKMGLRGSSFLALDCLTKVPWFIETDHQKMELAHKLAINKKICNFCLILPFWPSQWWVKLPKFLWIWTKIVDFLLMLHFRASFFFHLSVFISIGTQKFLNFAEIVFIFNRSQHAVAYLFGFFINVVNGRQFTLLSALLQIHYLYLLVILVLYSSSDLIHLVASAFACHKVSAHHQFANGTYFTASALVLKFSAFFQFFFHIAFIKN